MDIASTPLDQAVVIKLTGRMDAANAHEFQTECEAWIGRGSIHILADLSDLQYVSSMGLSCFLAVAKTLQPKSGSVILCRLGGLPRQVFEMTRLISLFPVFDTVDAAVASLP
ncbi:MAG TPA: STAS domain-containing protein [Bryobacteraceae bacterium]|jgi:anti-anti-sigma factor